MQIQIEKRYDKFVLRPEQVEQILREYIEKSTGRAVRMVAGTRNSKGTGVTINDGAAFGELEDIPFEDPTKYVKGA